MEQSSVEDLEVYKPVLPISLSIDIPHLQQVFLLNYHGGDPRQSVDIGIPTPHSSDGQPYFRSTIDKTAFDHLAGFA